jgi:hypothetical protein
MRFLCLFKPSPEMPPPTPEHFAKMTKYIEEMTKSGVLLATEGFQPSPEDVRVRLSGGKFTVTDGPFTEAKELIGGFAMLQAKSREEVIEHCKTFLQVVGGGESEVHQMLDAPNLPIEKAGR